MRRVLTSFCAAAMLLAACSDDAGPSAGSSTTAASGTGTTAPPGSDTTEAPTTTVAPVPEVPAGMQYEGTALNVLPDIGSLDVLPDGSHWFALGSVPSTVPNCPRGSGPCTRFANNPAFYTGPSPDALTPSLIDDAATLPPLPGFAQTSYLYAASVAHGATGYVAVGSASFWDSDLFYFGTVRAQIWQSADGVTWQRAAVPAGLADRLGELTAVKATNDGFVAVGHAGTGDDPNAGPSHGVVLTSPDGVTWAQVAELPSQWAVELGNVHAQGGLLQVSGITYVCDASASAMIDFSVGAQTVVYTSADGGATWGEVDLAAAGVADDRPAGPADPATCGDLSARSEYAWSLGGAFAAGGVFTLISADGGLAAVSTDLVEWATAQIPDGAPTTFEGIDLEPGVRLLTVAQSGLVLLSAEPRRAADGSQSGFGTSVLGWRSTDSGATWEELPTARPQNLAGRARLAQFTDGSVALAVDSTDAAGTAARTLMFSASGPLQEWQTCAPAPAANCAFAESLADVELAGADLTGVNLTGANLPDGVFDGATLKDAVLDGAYLLDASFEGTDLTGASLVSAELQHAVFTDAVLTGADFTDARLPGEALVNKTVLGATLWGATIYFAADAGPLAVMLAGADLREVSFSGPFESPADLHGASFAGANLAGAYFSGLDLTGADFVNAIFADDISGSALFSSNVVCPDGAPTTPDKYDREACRL